MQPFFDFLLSRTQVNIIEVKRSGIEIAEIAAFIQKNHLLKNEYKYSILWSKWLSIFYEISRIKNGYAYRESEIKSGNLSCQLAGLFKINKNHK